MAIHQQESQRRNNDKNFAARVVISITWERSSGRISFMVPGERHDGSGTSASVDPGLVLQDWLPAEIAELLRLPLFDESTYGRVRIHERTAQEYLAADWLASLRRKGLPRKQLDGLLFRRTPHVATPVLAPHLRATTAWLALDDVPTQRRLIEIAPDVLLGDGDPSGIPVDERPRILTAYVEQFRGRRRVLDSLAEISLRRFGCASLAEAINRSVPDTNLPQEVRRALLTIVAEGRIQACAATALQAATDRNLEAEVRADAVTAASATVEGAEREALLALVWEPNLDHSIGLAVLRALFPVSMTDEDVAALLINSARKPQNLYTGLQFFFEHKLDRLCTHERRLGLARRLLDLMQEPARPDLRWLARSLLTILRSILGGVTDGDRLPPQVEAAIDYFEEQQKLHHDFCLARQDGPASLLAGRPRTRRQLFWKRVREAEKVKGSRITKFSDVREWYWLVELDAEDHQWLADDAMAGEDEATRVLAFDALLWTRVRNGETAERTDLVRKLADQSPLLAQHLDRLAKVRERDDGFRGQHVRKMQAIDARRAQQLDQSRGALEAAIEEIRSGKDIQALWHLYCVVGGPLTTKGGTRVQEIERLYGPRVAGAYPEGLKNYWRQASVPAPHEWHSPGQFPVSAMLGLAGLSLEVAAGLRPSDLSQELRRLALRMALWEPNQPPSWFDDLAVAEPEEARALLLPLLKQEIAADGSEARVLRLDQIGRSSARLQTLVAKDMTQELQAMEPKRLDVLQSALACIEGVDASALDSLAPDRCRESEKEPKRLAIWLVAWMNRQGVAAADYLAAMLVGLDGSQAGEIVEEVLSRMWTWADERLGVTTFCIHKNAEALARLIPIAFAYVRRGEDLEHETAFSPGRRDHAQDMRDRLVAWLSSLPPQESLPQLRKLAAKPELGEIRDYLLHSVGERITADPGCAPWSPEAVVQWTQRFVREPSDSYELFHAVADVLEDIKDHAERGDHSNKELLNPKTAAILEKFVQIELVREMNQRAAGRFTAVPEEEVSTGNFPDIRAHNPRILGAITVEVKVGERGSYEQLRTSVREQLVARYLRDPASKYGILLVASSGPRRSWETSDGTTLATFADLLAQLQRDASQIAGEAGMKEVIVVGIDYH